MQKHFTSLLAPGLLLALALPAFAQTAAPNPGAPAPGNLLINGDFETAPGDDAKGWAKLNYPGVSIREEAGNHFLSLSNADIKRGLDIAQTIRFKAPAEGQKWVLTGRVRVQSTTPGTENWHTVRVQTTWLDDDKKTVTPWPTTPTFKAATDGWQPFTATLTLPPGATQLTIAPAIYYCLGEADYDDLELRPQDAPAAP